MGSSQLSTLARVKSSDLTYEQVIGEICNLNWVNLNEEDVIRVAWAYYYFLRAISGVPRDRARNVSR